MHTDRSVNARTWFCIMMQLRQGPRLTSLSKSLKPQRHFCRQDGRSLGVSEVHRCEALLVLYQSSAFLAAAGKLSCLIASRFSREHHLSAPCEVKNTHSHADPPLLRYCTSTEASCRPSTLSVFFLHVVLAAQRLSCRIRICTYSSATHITLTINTGRPKLYPLCRSTNHRLAFYFCKLTALFEHLQASRQ